MEQNSTPVIASLWTLWKPGMATAVKRPTRRLPRQVKEEGTTVVHPSVKQESHDGANVKHESDDEESIEPASARVRIGVGASGHGWLAPLPTRLTNGDLVFADAPSFRPNLTPSEVLRLGSFGGG
jgi:hypothetical protein